MAIPDADARRGERRSRALLTWYCVAMKRLASDVRTFLASIFRTGPLFEETWESSANVVFPPLHCALIASKQPAGKKWQAPQTPQNKPAAQIRLVIAPPPNLRSCRRAKDFQLKALKEKPGLTREHPDLHHRWNNPKRL
ncbi:hypothetical protein ACDY96_13680 [Rhizobium mongolense]